MNAYVNGMFNDWNICLLNRNLYLGGSITGGRIRKWQTICKDNRIFAGNCCPRESKWVPDSCTKHPTQSLSRIAPQSSNWSLRCAWINFIYIWFRSSRLASKICILDFFFPVWIQTFFYFSLKGTKFVYIVV